MTDQKPIEILTGPSKTALHEARRNYEVVEFTTHKGAIYEARILDIEREDGSGESWNLTAVMNIKGTKDDSQVMARMYYRTDTRRGRFAIVGTADASVAFV